MSQQQVINRLAENKRYILKLLDAMCDLLTLNATPTAGTTDVTYSVVTTSGSIPDGLYQYSISNIGDSDALIDTGDGNVVLPAGASLTFTAYLDPVTNEFKRPDGLSYDPQLSELTITQTP